MTLEQFAKKAGVSIIEYHSGCGGNLGYTEADRKNTVVGSFRTANAAYKHWLAGTFGKQTSKAILSLLRASEKK